MSLLTRFQLSSDADKEKAIERLITTSTPDFDFFFFVVLSVVMATLGLLLDSVAVIIGSMLIAPILYPVLSFSLGIVLSDNTLIYRSFFTLVKAAILAVIASILVTLFFHQWYGGPTAEILHRTYPSFAYFAVALVAGLAVSYSLAHPKLDSTLPGIAVSVALIPPLAVVGIGMATFSASIAGGSLVLFVLNIIGIMFASVLSFALMNLYRKKKVVHETIKKEELRVEQEDREIKAVDTKEEHSV